MEKESHGEIATEERVRGTERGKEKEREREKMEKERWRDGKRGSVLQACSV